MRLFDTHCHLQDRAFAGEFDAVVERAQAAGVGHMLLCGYDLPSSEAAVTLAAGHESIHPAVGVHPHDAAEADTAVLDRIAELAAREDVAAVGEIGLDFYRDLSPRDRQRAVIEAQLAIAVATGKPVSVHTRGAEEEAFEQLGPYAARSPLGAAGRPPGVMHCFGGTVEQARRYVDLGFVVSVPCTVTYPNNENGRRIAAELPLESLVIETDSPYLPPQGRRGKRNEPGFIGAAVEAIASLRGIEPAEVAEATTANACRVFGVTAGEKAVAR